MKVRYDFSVSKEVEIEPEFKCYFGRLVIPYGKYSYRFDINQIHHERAIQKMLKLHPEIKGKIELQDTDQ